LGKAAAVPISGIHFTSNARRRRFELLQCPQVGDDVADFIVAKFSGECGHLAFLSIEDAFGDLVIGPIQISGARLYRRPAAATFERSHVLDLSNRSVKAQLLRRLSAQSRSC
jgi:hypothetical protein